jgi:hypothetical protein
MQVRKLTRTIPKGKTKRKKIFMYIQRGIEGQKQTKQPKSRFNNTRSMKKIFTWKAIRDISRLFLNLKFPCTLHNRSTFLRRRICVTNFSLEPRRVISRSKTNVSETISVSIIKIDIYPDDGDKDSLRNDGDRASLRNVGFLPILMMETDLVSETLVF